MLYYVGIDIGGTNIKYGLLKSNGEIIEDSQIKTNTKGSEIIQSIVKIVKEYQKKFQIKAVGISAPGIILDNGFMVTGGAIHDFYGINLKITLEELIELPIFIENDANCAALAEKWLGAGSKFQSFATVVVGTGIGGGLIINNQLFRGANANAGEFGFMLVEPIKNKDTRMATLSLTGSVGCGIVNKYTEKKELEESDILNGEQIFEKMNQGEEVAKSVIHDFYDRLSIGLFNLIVTFDPEIILIGGAISNNPVFISELNTRIKNVKEDHRDMTNVVFPEILPCRFFNKAGIIGAAYKAIISEK